MDTQTEAFDRRFAVSEPADLVLSDISGTVTIAAWDLPDIHVAGVKRAGGFLPWISPEEGFRATRIEMEQQGSRVVVRTSRTQEGFWGFLNWLGGAAIVDYSIRVPRNCNVVVDLVAGSLSVSGVRGSVMARTVSANCSIKALDGKIVVNTVSGSVVAEDVVGQAAFKTVSGAVGVREGRYLALSGNSVSGDFSLDTTLSPDGRYDFETISGRVRILLPRDTRCVAEVQSLSGTLRSDLPGEAREIKHGNWQGEFGSGQGAPIRVRLGGVSGSLHLTERGAGAPVDFSTPEPSAERARPSAEPAATAAPPSGAPAASPTAPTTAGDFAGPNRESIMMLILEAVERGELTVDEAATKLAELDRLARDRGSSPDDSTDTSAPGGSGRGEGE